MIARGVEELLAAQGAARSSYVEFLRSASMSAGLYVLGAGDIDHQTPHGEDEVYVVLRGRARFTAGAAARDVSAGDTIYVPAGLDHRFHDIEEQLVLVVVFAPPELGRDGSP